MSEETVGPVVGPLSSTDPSSSAVRYTPSNVQFDVAIGGLPFMKAVSDERPYARETADFRRQQIDQGPSSSDQSLTGYWTRGQLSFHRGAGLTFYELNDGESVLNRFSDSLGVDPWTPGAVTLRTPVSEINSMAVLDVVLFDGDLAVLRSDGAVYQVTYAGTATALPLTGAGLSTSITTDGVNLYATNGADVEVCAPGGAFSALFTHPTPKDWAQIWWAKDRLWMMDVDGDLFVEAPAGTLAIGDLLWSSGYANAAWSLVESEGAVFLAAMDTIWAASIDSSTATPVLGAPTVVGRVGAQETIGAIGEYLGYLTVVSSAGVRIARIGDGILLGDLIHEADGTNCSRLAYRRSLVLTTGVTSGTTYLYELDLLEQVSDLQPAYVPMRSLGTTSSKHGAFVLPDGRVGYFSSEGIFLEDSSLGSATGTIRTAFHRFGTLEPKDFRSVSVFASGTGGTVGVSLVRRDGTTQSIVTLGASNFSSNEMNLNLTEPADYIGLEFTITAEAGVAPTLLGYQLRALPAPSRQRLIQIPLMLMDEEVVGNSKHGYRGWARDRLFELEEMEMTAGAVTYQDFLLDETATVFIEKIQFQNTTPQRPDGNGFGGFLMVYLRKVA